MMISQRRAPVRRRGVGQVLGVVVTALITALLLAQGVHAQTTLACAGRDCPPATAAVLVPEGPHEPASHAVHHVGHASRSSSSADSGGGLSLAMACAVVVVSVLGVVALVVRRLSPTVAVRSLRRAHHAAARAVFRSWTPPVSLHGLCVSRT